MVATTGAKLLPADATHELRYRLLPRTTVLTPNVPEAQLILADAGRGELSLESVADLEEMARALHALGPRWVLVKGGHCPFRRDGTVARTDAEKELIIDVLYSPDNVVKLETSYQKSRNTHGTGCSLACKSATILLFLVPLIVLAFLLLVTAVSGVQSLTISLSRNRIESRQGYGCPAGRKGGRPIYRGRHQDSARLWDGKRTPEPLPLHLHFTIFSVSVPTEMFVIVQPGLMGTIVATSSATSWKGQTSRARGTGL